MATTISIKINKDLSTEFKECCDKRGYAVSKALTIFANNYIKSGVLPFPLDFEKQFPNENTKKTCIYIDENTKSDFAKKCKENNLDMNKIIRFFMDYCVSNNCLPL